MSDETNAMAFADGQKKALRAKIADLEASRSRLLAALKRIATNDLPQVPIGKLRLADGRDANYHRWMDPCEFARLVVEAEKGEEE